MHEQRNTARIPVRLEVQWNGITTRCPDVTSDVSLGGCYIESLNPVRIGQVLNLELCLTSNVTFPFRGEVRYHHPNIGFGIKFLKLSTFQQKTLNTLMGYWERAALSALAA